MSSGSDSSSGSGSGSGSGSTIPPMLSGGVPGGQAGYERFSQVYTVPLICALTRSLRSDIPWKSLLHSLLLGTRDARARVRLCALQGVSGVFSAGGDDALVLLPEALPFLSETQHDDDTRVEAATHSLLGSLAAASGEDLGRYLA